MTVAGEACCPYDAAGNIPASVAANPAVAFPLT
jgi:hypothetical protein